MFMGLPKICQNFSRPKVDLELFFLEEKEMLSLNQRIRYIFSTETLPEIDLLGPIIDG